MVALGAWLLPVCGQLAAQQAVIPMELSYERSGPTAEAALYAPDPSPDLGAAHKISLASKIEAVLTETQLAQLRKHGPWLTDDGLSENTQSLIRAIQNSRIHGLYPEAYKLSTLLETIDTLSDMDRWPLQAAFVNARPSQPSSLATSDKAEQFDSISQSMGEKQAPGSRNSLPISTLAPRFALATSKNRQPQSESISTQDRLRQNLNAMLDRSFTRLITDLGQGLVSGTSVQDKHYRKMPVIDKQKILQDIEQGNLSVAQVLRQIIPKDKHYERLTQRMRDLLTERESTVRRTRVPSISDKTGDEHDALSIAQRLFEVGLLPLTQATELDQNKLTASLKKFQMHNGLLASGKADAITRKLLNRTVEQEINAVALSLERWRWMPRDLGKLHILVNIPEYRVRVKEGTNSLLSMTAVVGTPKHKTPSFSRDMSYMEFNPTWTVPAKITDKKLIPLERQSPGYLKSRQFDFLERRGRHLYKVPETRVTRDDFNKTPFPYVLQQRGGPINALGKMKFMMPNPYAIYLHDTQHKKHFTLNDRAFSHGCIRLQRPEKLARLLMQLDGYDEQTIENKFDSDKTHRVRLRKHIPTHLTYLTTWVDDDNQLQTRPDIYDYDAALIKALEKSQSLLSQSAGIF